MIIPTPAETRQKLRDRGHMLPSDYELEQIYGNATIGAAYWSRGESVEDMKRDMRELERAIRGILGAFPNP